MSLSPSPRASTAVPLLGGMSSGHHCTWESGGLDASRSPTNSTAMSDLLVMGPVVESPRSQCPLSPGTLLADGEIWSDMLCADCLMLLLLH